MKYLITLLINFSLVHSQFAHAQAEGGCGGHGGDGISQEFYQIGNLLYQQIQKIPESELSKYSGKFKPLMLKQALEHTHIITSDLPVIINFKGKDVEVDAKNSIQNENPEITISRKRWKELNLPTDIDKKESLVLHEYLGIIKSLHPDEGEWDAYTLSDDIINTILSHAQLLSMKGESWTKQMLAEFEKSSNSFKSSIERGSNFSCVEYSLLNHLLPPITHLDLYNSSFLTSQMADDVQTIDATQTKISSEMRINTRGDLIVKKIDAENKNPQSILYCSKLGSKAVQMTKFLSTSLLPIFDMPKTDDYAAFQKKIKKLSKSPVASLCTHTSLDIACIRTYHRLDQTKLYTEHNAVINAKANVNQINTWLESLGNKKFLVNASLLDLYSKYAAHQSYLISLLDLNDSETHRESGLKNFSDSLEHRLPIAYENAKNEFLLETLQAEQALVESFSLLY